MKAALHNDDHLDPRGYRHNVAIVLCNRRRQVFWARRIRHDGWQFPQGGMRQDETPEEALYRELYEEVGLRPEQVRVMGRTREWLYYELPARLRRTAAGAFRGQKQVWYLLELDAPDSAISLRASTEPEFDAWRWVDYWRPLKEIVHFKRPVYTRALRELAPLIFPGRP